jgi:hypothetical protein
VLAAIREDLALHAPVEQVPAVLGDVDAPHARAGLDLLPLEVRHADEAGLPLADDVLEGAHRLLAGRHVVGPVDEVDVDAVGAEFSRLFSMEAMQRARLASRRFGLSRYPMPNLLTMIASLRRPPSARPRARSDAPRPYPSAVSKQLMPRSRARSTAADELRLLDPPVAAADLPAAEADGRDLEPRPSEWSLLHGCPSS